MKTRTRLVGIAIGAALAVLAFASTAGASLHLLKVREVYLGAAGNDAFVELQMPAGGQTAVAGQKIRIYTATGTLAGESPPFSGNVDSGQNQRTILIGDTAVEGRDFTYDMMTETVTFYNAGGAACFLGSNDCVSWGNFTETGGTLPGETGTPLLGATGITPGASITRKLTRGCKTALDGADDTDDSAADWAQTNTPSPRGNSTAPTERLCVPCGGKRSTITGTNGRDVLKGTPGRDVIAGRGGKDTIRGRGGRDILCGGKGRDKLVGGKGRDRLIGGPGRDAEIQ